MYPPNATLTIGDKTFHTGDLVSTPKGNGYIVSLDPLGDEEILVQHSESDILWFSFREVQVTKPNPLFVR